MFSEIYKQKKQIKLELFNRFLITTKGFSSTYGQVNKNRSNLQSTSGLTDSSISIQSTPGLTYCMYEPPKYSIVN